MKPAPALSEGLDRGVQRARLTWWFLVKNVLQVLDVAWIFPSDSVEGCPWAVNLYYHHALVFSKHWTPEECHNNNAEMVRESWRSLPAMAQVPLPSADVLDGCATPKVTVTLSSAICPAVGDLPNVWTRVSAKEQLEDSHVCSATFYIKQK